MFKLNHIIWYDHCSHETSQWRDIDEATELKPILVASVGYVIHEDSDVVVLGQSLMIPPEEDDFDDKYAGDICILKILIQDRREIEL